jgi:hypothetical protein
MADEIGVDFRHFLCNEAVLDGLGAIVERLLVTKGGRAETLMQLVVNQASC